jgi:hypothetical protein
MMFLVLNKTLPVTRQRQGRVSCPGMGGRSSVRFWAEFILHCGHRGRGVPGQLSTYASRPQGNSGQ